MKSTIGNRHSAIRPARKHHRGTAISTGRSHDHRFSDVTHARSARRRRAFTIVEVTLAVFVLATAIATSLLAIQRAFVALDTARNLDVAGHIMQCELEKERLLGWSQVSDAAYQPVIDASFLGNPAVAGRFTLSRSLTPVAGHSGQLVQVTLTVTWLGFDGQSHTRSYVTWFGKDGLNAYFNSTP